MIGDLKQKQKKTGDVLKLSFDPSHFCHDDVDVKTTINTRLRLISNEKRRFIINKVLSILSSSCFIIRVGLGFFFNVTTSREMFTVRTLSRLLYVKSSAHLAYHVHKNGRKTSTIIIIICVMSHFYEFMIFMK